MAKKLLLINGGGQFGIIPAFFLSRLKGFDFREKIDCLSGSSIGGILAAAYAAGADPREIFDIFPAGCKEIFKKRIWARMNPLTSPTYDNEALLKFIEQYVESAQSEISNAFNRIWIRSLPDWMRLKITSKSGIISPVKTMTLSSSLSPLLPALLRLTSTLSMLTGMQWWIAD